MNEPMDNDDPLRADTAGRLQRWRLILGTEAEESCGKPDGSFDEIDKALATLYEPDGQAAFGKGRRRTAVARWLGDIRKYFPSAVVQVMQHDAMERLNLRELLVQPEMLGHVVPDVHLVADIMALSGVIPEETKHTARIVVRKVVDELMQKLEAPMRMAVSGGINRSVRNNRPRFAEIDWNRTIRANLRHYQAAYRSIVPERLIGFGRKMRRPQREVHLVIDQSGSMAHSIVYSSIFGAVMASMPVLMTRLVLFDTHVVDMTDALEDPVDLLFGVQLGGGTAIEGAVGYAQGHIRDPRNAIMVLISDLYDSEVSAKLIARAMELLASGVQLIVLLALSDEGKPTYDQALAAKLAAIGAPCFACTPAHFPGLMAAAIKREDVNIFASKAGMVTVAPEQQSLRQTA
ncbi:VWA domain-containing protein [Verminephrobacter aporrectodeae subsp. tuberculatae]|uniref:VWA domain-containing protein n=1 Tax=Verminephrobacter aporrectodeae TaxID=1110389 RepID=UPI002243CAD4|nr:VWA domain-containing protein [Verminephrobacter aporrectodeae]MCW8165709.1 VWA domain-containing protein [Verminephrobacter aporrectodeae subsp. tuberculatae]MCW8169682.1 VWA domain-containing protein [Verminephrobacter aporrectodeae subsp. tuberculatae]